MPGTVPHRLAVIGLLLLTAIAFGRTLSCDFVNLDDSVYVTQNPPVQAGLTARGFRWAWTTWHAGLWLPLTWLSLQLDAGIYGNQAYGFHLTNVILHAANVVLLYGLLVSMTGRPERSLAAAALFAVHPLRVESVAWVAERKDVLSTFFWMLTLHAYVHYVRRPGPGRYLTVAVTYALGLLAKPMLVTLPCVLLLLDWWPLHRLAFGSAAPPAKTEEERIPPPAVVSLKWIVAEKLPLFLLAAIASVITVRAQASVGAVHAVWYLSVADRLANVIRGYAGYLAMTFWPLNLSVFYPHPHSAWTYGPVILAAAVIVSVSVVVLALRRFPYLLMGWLWFLGTLVPVIGFVQSGEQAMADRFTYVPHIGLIIALVWGVADLLETRRWPADRRIGLTLAVTACLTVLTIVQVGCWTNSTTLWRQALEVMPDNYYANASMGLLLFAKGDLKGAEEHYRASLQVRPDASESNYNLGVVLMRQGRSAEAEQSFREELRLHAGFINARYNLGTALLRQGKPAEAAEEYARVVKQQPRDAEAHLYLGIALAQSGKPDEALSHFAASVELNPNSPEAQNNLGRALLRRGELNEAVEHLRASSALNKKFAIAYNNLGIALGRLKRWPEAVSAQKDALRLDPAMPVVYRCDLAYALYGNGQREDAETEYQRSFEQQRDWAIRADAEARRLLTAPESDVARATELALETCQASKHQDPRFLQTLALARAAAGQWDEAVATLREALARVPADATPDLARELREEIQRYQSRKSAPAASAPGS